MRGFALSAFVLAAACVARSGDLAPTAGIATATASATPWDQFGIARHRKEQSEAEAQRRKPIDGLTEDDLFKELDEALSGGRQGAVLRKLELVGSLGAAERLDDLAARFRAHEMMRAWQQPQNAYGLECSAEEIRFRLTGDRKHQVRMWMIMTNPADGRAVPRLDEIVRQGLIEVRGNLVGLADRGSRETNEETRRAILLLDIWEQARTAEETFVRAVEQDEHFPLKACGVDYLLELDEVSDSTRGRVRSALLPRVEAALERVRRDERSLVFGVPSATERAATEEDFGAMCLLYAFWLKHSKEELRAARDSGFVLFAPCGMHYVEGEPASHTAIRSSCP